MTKSASLSGNSELHTNMLVNDAVERCDFFTKVSVAIIYNALKVVKVEESKKTETGGRKSK